MCIEHNIVHCIPYDELIDELIETCDSFSLVTSYVPFVNSLAKYKEYGITVEESEEVLERLYASSVNDSKISWDRTPKEMKERLSTFENILDEAVAYREKISASSTTEDDFMDQFNHSGPDFESLPYIVQRIYSIQRFYGEMEFRHKELVKGWKRRDVMEELNVSNNELLLKNHIKYELSHFWPLTVTSELMVIHYFKCNEETKKWLKQRRNIFDFGIFEDLDFFRDGKCVMGVCTHEEWSFIEFPWRKKDLHPQN